MKRSLLGSTLLLSLVLAAQAPAQVEVRGRLRDPDRARIEAEAGDAARAWRVEMRAPSGAVTRVNGTIELRGESVEARFSDFLARYGPIFDANLPGAGPVELGPLEVLTWHGAGRARHVRAKQFVHGFEATGHGLTLELDEKGNARCVHGIVSTELARMVPPTVAEADAVRKGAERFAALGFPLASFRNPPHVASRRVEWIEGQAVAFYRVEGVLAGSYEPLACDVDAHTAEVLRDVPAKCTFFGEGTFKSGGQTGAFKTGTGKGVVYKDFKAASDNKWLTQTLPELGKETALPGFADDGTLFGRFSWILNEVLTQQGFVYLTIQGNNYQFLGFPSDVLAAQADLFDATNCYFHLTKFALGMTKIAKQALPTDFAMPTIVNSPQFAPEEFNAFFSTSDPGFGTGPGFMLFGDPSWATGALADDFSRDPSVMCHEYTHAIAEFAGLGFGSPPLNVPNRAVNEAIADYFAASFFKDPRVGLPLFKLGSAAFVQVMGLTSDGLRNIAAPKTMFDNLFDVTVGGIPEEHAAGHIFACALWRVRLALGQKVADEVIFNSLFNWPQDLTELGYQVFGPGNADQAYLDFFEACLAQLVADAFTAKGKAAGLKAAGAVLVNGCIGMPEGETAYVLDLSMPATTNLSSGFFGSSEGHLIGFGVNGGQTVDVTVTGDKKVNTKVDLVFLGTPGGLAFPNQAVKSTNSVKIHGVKVIQGGVYGLLIQNKGIVSNVFKPYKVTIRVK